MPKTESKIMPDIFSEIPPHCVGLFHKASSGNYLYFGVGDISEQMRFLKDRWVLVASRVAAGGYEQEVEELIKARLELYVGSEARPLIDAKIDRANNMADAWREWGAGG